MFNRVHGESGKGFDVGVPVVERVDILVHRLDVDEPVGKVEVELAVERHQEGTKPEGHGPEGAGEGLLVAEVGQPARAKLEFSAHAQMLACGWPSSGALLPPRR